MMRPPLRAAVSCAAVSCAAVSCAAALSAQNPTVDVQSYHFRVNIPDTGSTITALASILYETRRGYDDTLRLDLVGMSVRRVFDIHTLRQLRFLHDGRTLRIVTSGTPARRLRGVVVEYSGSPQDGLIFRDNARGRRSVFGDNFPNRARYWLPVVDHPSDKARVLWSIRIPRGWRGVANQPECLPQPRPVRCDESRPLPPHLMVLGATEMTRSIHRPLLRGRDTIPMEVIAYPEDSAWADSVPFRRITAIAETLQRMIGPFPYAKLSHVQSSTRYGGGMENATVIFYAERRYVEQNLRESTVRHETAHQWFGDAVTPRDWPHLWLSEGFAVYFGFVAGAALDGDSVLEGAMRAAATTYFNSPVTGRPVLDTTQADPNLMLNANTYQKGAWVLHMLRHEVGDSAFFRGVREYYRQYRDSSVTSAQFQRVMERASGDSLGSFFNQWLRQPGYPRLDVVWRTDSAARSVTLETTQAQPAEWGRYRVRRLPILLVLPDGRTLLRTMQLNPRYAAQTHTIMMNPGDGLPVEVVMDPRGALLLQSTTRRDPQP